MAPKNSEKTKKEVISRRNPFRDCRLRKFDPGNKPDNFRIVCILGDPKTNRARRIQNISNRLFKVAVAKLEEKVAAELSNLNPDAPPQSEEIISLDSYLLGELDLGLSDFIPDDMDLSPRTVIILRSRSVSKHEKLGWIVGPWVEGQPLILTDDALETLEDQKVEVFRNWRRKNITEGSARKNDLRLWLLECAVEGKKVDPALRKWANFDNKEQARSKIDPNYKPPWPAPYRYFPPEKPSAQKIPEGFVKVERKGFVRAIFRPKKEVTEI